MMSFTPFLEMKGAKEIELKVPPGEVVRIQFKDRIIIKVDGDVEQGDKFTLKYDVDTVKVSTIVEATITIKMKDGDLYPIKIIPTKGVNTRFFKAYETKKTQTDNDDETSEETKKEYRYMFKLMYNYPHIKSAKYLFRELNDEPIEIDIPDNGVNKIVPSYIFENPILAGIVYVIINDTADEIILKESDYINFAKFQAKKRGFRSAKAIMLDAFSIAPGKATIIYVVFKKI